MGRDGDLVDAEALYPHSSFAFYSDSLIDSRASPSGQPPPIALAR